VERGERRVGEWRSGGVEEWRGCGYNKGEKCRFCYFMYGRIILSVLNYDVWKR
jgi:hypothetical protein